MLPAMSPYKTATSLKHCSHKIIWSNQATLRLYWSKANDKQVSWATKWEAPNGFVKEEKLANKGPTINVPFTFSEAAAAGELEHGDRVSVTVFAEFGGQKDSEKREFIIHIPTEELQVWEVFFDNQDQDSSLDGARRLDPLVFDLNRDGRATQQMAHKPEMVNWTRKVCCLT